ncbi:AAA family ATPase, partial [Microbacterium sp.]|uniref:AAA family ATPase n=1 Tax=Microbacterium sp. TaxID=51671 RepID=UPI003A8B250E
STWTAHTVTEHATRIMTEQGVRAAPGEVRDFIMVASRLALEDCFTILPPGAPRPEHVAHLTSVRVMQAETELRDLMAARVPENEPALPDVRQLVQTAGLDAGQTEAAAAVASTDALVIVEGAAGSGKTTMLGVAIEVAQQEGRPTRVVAPTKKAADVAHRALGIAADSVAALVHAHGYRWNTDGVWTRLAPGDTDTETGRIYTGPPETARLQAGERIVVDEAGMLDQDSALALFTVAAETGATLALVGDRAQLPAVGRGGVLDMAAQIRGRTTDMNEVHRFTDPAYAELSMRLRDRDDPAAIFDQLRALGLIHLHADTEHLHEHIAKNRSDGEAVTVATNDEATRLNARIRDERTHAEAVDDERTATGSDGLPIGRGDLIQTRKNDTTLGVANRQLWVVQHVTDDGALWAVEAGSDRKREHTVQLPAEYVTEHTHLAYASTAYGVQGITTPASHTILTDAMSGAAVYVGMTRGTDENVLHVVAENTAEARLQFIDAVERDRADRGLADATQHAVEAVRGLVDDGPVKLVNTEIAALTQQAEHAEQRAALWQQAADALTELHARQRDARDQAAQIADSAARQLERVRAEVAAPLTEQASAALGEWQDGDTAQRVARDRLRTVGRFGKRRATTEHHTAQALAHDSAQRLTSEWGEPPRWNEDAAAWVERVTRPRIDTDPGVIEATAQQEAAARAVRKTFGPDPWPRLRIYARIFGTDAVVNNRAVYLTARPHANAEDATRTAAQARAEIEALRALTPAEAVERIEQTRATEQAAREAANHALRERQRQLDPSHSHTHDSTPHYGGPSLGR